MIQHNACKTASIPLPKHVYHFLRQQREPFLAQLRQQLNLRRVELIERAISSTYNNKTTTNTRTNNNNTTSAVSNEAKSKHNTRIAKSRHFVEVEGHPAKIARLEQELASISVRRVKAIVQYRKGTPPSLPYYYMF